MDLLSNILSAHGPHLSKCPARFEKIRKFVLWKVPETLRKVPETFRKVPETFQKGKNETQNILPTP
jgi:hypothetical protein